MIPPTPWITEEQLELPISLPSIRILDADGNTVAIVYAIQGDLRETASMLKAAPDLLEACENLLGFAEYNMPGNPGHICGPESQCDALCMEAAAISDLIYKAKTAIAKAKGSPDA